MTGRPTPMLRSEAPGHALPRAQSMRAIGWSAATTKITATSTEPARAATTPSLTNPALPA